MSPGKVFRVAVIAELEEREWRVLSTATRLTTGRARSYVFEPCSNAAPDIYLVDGDDANSRQALESISILYPAPTVFLKTMPDPAPEKREFSRQIVPSCLLKLVTLLDHISVQELRFLPELSIGHEGTSSDNALVVPAPSGNADGGRFSALVVDDSSTVRAQVGLGLKLFGANADFAESAEEAFTLLEKNSYDIALLDVVLPGADGYQICKLIKKNPKHKETVVVMLTSKSSAFDRVKASLAGCDTFLTKPVQNEQFQEVLGKYLTNSATETHQPLGMK
jgi:twitching motility two-component system response regulator PilG